MIAVPFGPSVQAFQWQDNGLRARPEGDAPKLERPAFSLGLETPVNLLVGPVRLELAGHAMDPKAA